jgi:Peptidase family M23
MFFKNTKLMLAAKRSIRITLSICVIGIANTAAAENFFTQFLTAATTNSAKTVATKPTVAKGELIYVVCSDIGGARVRNTEMNAVLFNATQLETLKPFQGWGENKKLVQIGSEKLSFVRVQFDSSENRPTNIGWIAEKFVKLKSMCPVAAQAQKVENISNVQITGLSASNCCRFPITHVPYQSYTTGERMFGALRGKGRIHAASDLYGRVNEPIIAVAPGKVIRGLYDFYYSTYAIDVKHQGGFVVRYGEISGKRTVKANTGNPVKMGQTIAYMGQLVPRIRPPMLHFELYRGDKTGALNVGRTRKNGFGRRTDLINPTKHLQRWEQAAF